VPAIAAGLMIAPLGLSAAVLLYAALAVAVAVIGVTVQALPGRETRRTPRHQPTPVISPEKRP